ncbi:uncharacterized protein BKA78DRAFT_119892 [Phyllosticta capitalensis]|uniref:uncharacterized protein n=1 Tax=Phyllosticta capitalensis TaxID=121624 RepID=UPI0031309577
MRSSTSQRASFCGCFFRRLRPSIPLNFFPTDTSTPCPSLIISKKPRPLPLPSTLHSLGTHRCRFTAPENSPERSCLESHHHHKAIGTSGGRSLFLLWAPA